MAHFDLHTHTVYSDGKNTPEEMIQTAISLGLDAIGFSEHSWVDFDPHPDMPLDKYAAYQEEIAALKEKYAGKIRVLCGVEQDYYAEASTAGFDYTIGSAHYVLKNGNYIGVDDTPEILRRGIDEEFGGDVYALTDAYWENVSHIVEKTGCDIIGHLDLIRKFNKNGEFFDEQNPRYIQAAKKAIDALLKTGKVFEINTGAISRGWQDTPYPAPNLMEYIREHGGKFILSSDSHSTQTLCFEFAKYSDWQTKESFL